MATSSTGMRPPSSSGSVGAAGTAIGVVDIAGAQQHFGWLGRFFGLDAPASNRGTRETLNWQPTHRPLLDDLEHGDYFRP